MIKPNLILYILFLLYYCHSNGQINKVDIKTFIDKNISKNEYKIDQFENELSKNSLDHSLLLNKAVRFKIYFDAQDYTTKRYSENCLNISNQIKLSNELIKHKFSSGIESSNFLITVAKEEDLDFQKKYEKIYDGQIEKYSKYQTFLEEDCNSALEELIRRKDGIINIQNYNQNILALNYILNPVEEIINNDYKIFSTINNQNNDGFFLTVKLPKSWMIKDKNEFSNQSTIGFFEPFEKFLNSSIYLSTYPGFISQEDMKKNKLTDNAVLSDIYSDNEILTSIITVLSKELKSEKISCTMYNDGNVKYILYTSQGNLGQVMGNSLLNENLYKSLSAFTIRDSKIVKITYSSSNKIGEFDSYNYYSKLFFKVLTSVKFKTINTNTIYLTEEENMKFIPVEINDVDYNFLLDTGASNIVINKKILNNLLLNGFIGNQNFIKKSKSVIANGDVVNTEEWLIPELKIRNNTIKNIIVSVVDSEDSIPLFGMDGLNKLNVVKLNLNENEIIINQQ